MCPVLVLVLLLAAENSATFHENNTGRSFVVVFPEIIASYSLPEPQNKVQITALYDKTTITIKSNTNYILYPPTLLLKGQSWDFEIAANLVLRRLNETVQISSDKDIIVYAINRKENSVQTALVIPTDKLATRYLIPPVPKIPGTTEPATLVTTDVTERSPFKLIIINGVKKNKISIEGKVPQNITLDSNKTYQIWLKESEELRTVNAEEPVAVIFGHACAMREACTCGQLYSMLPPAKAEELKFYVPPVLNNTGNGSFVLLSDQESTKVEAFDPDTPLVTIAGTAIFYHPGLLLPLIPEMDFATCYFVNNNNILGESSSAVIIVHEDFTDEVHIRGDPLKNAQWQKLKGTEYVSTVVKLETGKSIIWHASSKMAVYFMGKMTSVLFGNPAAIISKTADFRGCVLSPEIVKIGDVAAGWRESLKYCRDRRLELVSFPEARLQTQIYNKILQANNASVPEVWIGMRRSSYSGEWYWLSKDPVNDTNWEEGEPGTVHDGQCAIMSLEKNKDFGWRDEDCCKAAHPICYKKPVFLTQP